MKILEQALNKINLNKHQVKFFIIAITGFIGIIGKRTTAIPFEMTMKN